MKIKLEVDTGNMGKHIAKGKDKVEESYKKLLTSYGRFDTMILGIVIGLNMNSSFKEMLGIKSSVGMLVTTISIGVVYGISKAISEHGGNENNRI